MIEYMGYILDVMLPILYITLGVSLAFIIIKALRAAFSEDSYMYDKYELNNRVEYIHPVVKGVDFIKHEECKEIDLNSVAESKNANKCFTTSKLYVECKFCGNQYSIDEKLTSCKSCGGSLDYFNRGDY